VKSEFINCIASGCRRPKAGNEARRGGKKSRKGDIVSLFNTRRIIEKMRFLCAQGLCGLIILYSILLSIDRRRSILKAEYRGILVT
jgi:hypothetical protein